MAGQSYEFFDQRRERREKKLQEEREVLQDKLLRFHRKVGADMAAWTDGEQVGEAHRAARGLVACNYGLLTIRLQRLLADRAHGREQPGDRGEVERLERQLGTGRPGTAALEGERQAAEERLSTALSILQEVQPGTANAIRETCIRLQSEAKLNGGSAIVHLVRWEKQTSDELERLLSPLLANNAESSFA